MPFSAFLYTRAKGLNRLKGIREFLSYPEVQQRTGLSGKIKDATVVIQGFGNVGYYAAKFFESNGYVSTWGFNFLCIMDSHCMFVFRAKVIGIGERDCAIYDPSGLNIEKLYKHHRETGSFRGFSSSAKIIDEPAKVLELECDILIPAALERQIGLRNVHNIKAKLIGEAANGPVTPGAHEVLEKRGVVVIPDLLLNAGGVTVSYFEWLKNLSHVRFGRMNKKWDESVRRKLLQVVEENAGRKLTEAERKQIVHGAEEADLIYSGLEDTMISASEGNILEASSIS